MCGGGGGRDGYQLYGACLRQYGTVYTCILLTCKMMRPLLCCCFCCFMQSVGRSDAYSSIILRYTPAVVSLAVVLVNNVSEALAPHLQQQQQQQQQGVSLQQQQQQQLAQATSAPLLSEQLYRCQQDIESSTAAAVRAAAMAAAGGSNGSNGGSNGSSAAVPFPGGEDEVRVAFKLVRRLVDLLRDMRDRCR